MDKIKQFFTRLFQSQAWKNFCCHWGIHQEPKVTASRFDPNMIDTYCPNCGIIIRSSKRENLEAWTLDN